MPRLLRLVIGTRPAHYRLLAAVLTGGAVVAWSATRLTRVVVDGDSMRPTLDPGDRLVVVRGRRARTGDLVVLPDPRAPERAMVKRVARVDRGARGGNVVVRGDNPGASTDSRVFGPVPAASIGGRVVYRYLPPERRGRPQRATYRP
jgi:nickel-type superoxide dismutase maturation protease